MNYAITICLLSLIVIVVALVMADHYLNPPK